MPACWLVSRRVARNCWISSTAKAATAAPAAAKLDDNSVSALLALEQAMENVAARVTPATVNVTVTSKASARNARHVAQGWRRRKQRHAAVFPVRLVRRCALVRKSNTV